MLNTVVLGRYEVKKKIRENELFSEYWGEDTKIGRDVALTVVHAVPSPDFFSRFEPASKKFSSQHSGNLPALIELCDVNGQATIIRQYIEGQSLRSALDMGQPLALEMALELAQQIGEYLDALHRAGLLQLDFESEDILIAEGGAFYIANFGIASGVNLGALLAADKIPARPSFAPELLQSGKADERADFYSAGALLFEALTGKKPALRLESEKTAAAEDLRPSSLRMGVSPEWDALVSRCLHPNPAKRIQSAAEFLNQVDEIRRAASTLPGVSPLSMEDSLVGQTLGPYRLVSRLGQGGMATVYKAYEPALDRYVAVKVLPQFFAGDPIFVQRFRREAKAVAQLNHPNIVPIYSYGESSGITYIAMQFVVGDTLKHEGQKFSFEEALRLLIPIARALGYAHQRGVVHRDVKPSNILIAEDGKWPLLADFGLAQMTQASGKLTESGVGMGTPMYMSPEQGQGEQVDHRSDIYSLGIVLYELVTGEVPFRADTPMAIVIKHISAPMPMPSKVNPETPDFLETIILKATAKNPADRFQTAEEMAQAMENALARLTSSESRAQAVSTPPVVPLAPPPQPQPQGETASVVVLKGVGSFFKGLYRLLLFLIILGLCLPLSAVIGMAIFKICPPQGPWAQPPWCAGSPYQFTVGENVPPAPGQPAHQPESRSDVVLQDFEGENYWQAAFDDAAQVAVACRVDESRALRDSKYLNFQFSVPAGVWATCGFDYEQPQDWRAYQGLAFDLRADQANLPYEVLLFDDADGMYLFQTRVPAAAVDSWTRVEIPWSKILRVEWEENGGEPIDPARVQSFRLQVVAGEATQTGALWVDNLSLASALAPADPAADLFFDDFENPAWTKLEAYAEEGKPNQFSCVLEKPAAQESAFALKFDFEIAPDSWASCGLPFDVARDWRAGKGIAFRVYSGAPNLEYEVSVVTGAHGEEQNYLYAAFAADGWREVTIPWESFLRAEWEENAGAPLIPLRVVGLWFGVNAAEAGARGTLWVDDVRVLP